MRKIVCGLLCFLLCSCWTLEKKAMPLKEPEPQVDLTRLFYGPKGEIVQFNHYRKEPKDVFHLLGEPTYD